MKKYGVLNPNNGTYSFVDSEEEALRLFWSRMLNFSRHHFHNTPYSIIDIDKNGNQIWSSASGEIIDTPLTIEQMKDILNLSDQSTPE